VTELDLSWSKLVSLPTWLQQSFPKLRKVSLRGCDSLDFGALSTFLNESMVREVDLSSCYTLMTLPTAVSVLINIIRGNKTLEKIKYTFSGSFFSTIALTQTILLNKFSLSGIPIDPAGALAVIQALVWNFSQGLFSLQSLE